MYREQIVEAVLELNKLKYKLKHCIHKIYTNVFTTFDKISWTISTEVMDLKHWLKFKCKLCIEKYLFQNKEFKSCNNKKLIFKINFTSKFVYRVYSKHIEKGVYTSNIL